MKRKTRNALTDVTEKRMEVEGLKAVKKGGKKKGEMRKRKKF